jgi:cytochrome b
MNARSEFSKVRIASKSDEQGSIPVWDPVVRLFHWTVVAGCAINLIIEEGNKFHRAVGYVVAAAVAVRVLWGFVGAGHARFTDFVPTPAALVGYLRRLFSRTEPRYIEHNPAGSVMILALLGSLIAVSITGWMMGLDRFLGNEAVEELHETFAMTIVVLAGIHVAAAIFESIRHRENLIKAMFTGRKRGEFGVPIQRFLLKL